MRNRLLGTLLLAIAGLAPAAPANDYPALITGAWEEANFRGKLPYRIFGGRSIQAGKRYPLVIYLHGIHVRGDDNQKHLTGEAKSFGYQRHYSKRPCFIIAPQCPKRAYWTGAPGKLVIDLVKELTENLPIDCSRIYLTGYSMGGYGTWSLLAQQPKLFAAAIPVAGGGEPKQAARYKNIPVWAFHGEKDAVVSATASQQMVDALKQAGGNIRYTEFKGSGHLVSKQVYLDDSVHRWLFEQKRKD